MMNGVLLHLNKYKTDLYQLIKKNMKLYQAAHIIQEIYKIDLVFIEFEDGSEVKFNYRLKGQSKKSFINLKNFHYDNTIKQITEKM